VPLEVGIGRTVTHAGRRKLALRVSRVPRCDRVIVNEDNLLGFRGTFFLVIDKERRGTFIFKHFPANVSIIKGIYAQFEHPRPGF
jgi:hypothetical protein